MTMPGRKQLQKVAISRYKALQKHRINVNNDPLINTVFLQFRTVRAAAANEQHISRLQQIPLAFHHIAAAAGNQQQKFTKLMIMILYPCAGLGFEMKQPEILQQISPLFILCHILSPHIA